jgi:hypothetical protein
VILGARTVLWAIAISLVHGAAMAAALPRPLIRAADSFDRSELHLPSSEGRVRAAHDLSGGGSFLTGWFEYDFAAEGDGWVQLIVRSRGDGVEFTLDPGLPTAMRLFGTGLQRDGSETVGNLWLSRGPHRLRLRLDIWMGFPPVSAIELRPSDGSLAQSFALQPHNDRRLFRKGECEAVEVYWGANRRPARLLVFDRDARTGQAAGTQDLTLAPAVGLMHRPFPLPCADAGKRELTFGEGGQPFASPQANAFRYEVVESRPTPAATAASTTPAPPPSAGSPVLDIDCGTREPDYTAGGSRVARRTFGSYRESGDVGLTRYQRTPEPARRLLPAPSWFAYRLDGLDPDRPYRIAVDFPDDTLRTFMVAFREPQQISYAPSVAVVTGGEYLPTDTLATQSLPVWPHSRTPRLVFMTVHDGSRAACAHIRVYRSEGTRALVPPQPGKPATRELVNWYEEGTNFTSVYAASDLQTGVDRWVSAAVANGVSTLMPTAFVYAFALYPSALNRTFADATEDTLRRILFAAEDHGLRVIADLHPRADDLAWGYGDSERVPPNLARSGDGQTNFYASSEGHERNVPPYFNALDPGNQAWYVGLVGELADRYRDSPAFSGVSLRYMPWANPALHNLVSLDWGYDDATVARFASDTGTEVPQLGGNDPGRYASRRTWLLSHARDQWVGWRCRSIATLISKVRDRVRAARPDLKVYLNMMPGSARDTPSFSQRGGGTLESRLREAGLDPRLLGVIDGVVLINSAYTYGRIESASLLLGDRDLLTDPAALGTLRQNGDGGRYLQTARNQEATDAVVPALDRLGLRSDEKKIWVSAAGSPPGRYALERYAVALAEEDAVLLGDGFNGYTFGPPELNEFIAVYRRLPAVPFGSLNGAQDPVAVRTLNDGSKTWFYAVNRERYPVRIALTFSRPASITPLPGGGAEPQGIELVRDLKPFELFAATAERDVTIVRVTVTAPAAERERVAEQVQWIERLGRSAAITRLAEPDRALLADAARTAHDALTEGRLWRAHTVLEHSAILAIYNTLGCSPPGLPFAIGSPGGCI